MESSLVLGRIRGIAIGVHYSWLLIFALVTLTLALGFFPQSAPGLSPIAYWAMGVLASLLLFASVLIHELSHSFVAQALGIGAQSITLFIFGGVSNVRGEARTGRDELLMAVAGPIASVALSLMFGLVYLLIRGTGSAASAVLGYLTMINMTLALFNLIPGFPLDGGRVLRSVLWMVTGNFRRATNIATGLGQVVALLFIAGGVLIALQGNIVSGLWLALIGWFLDNAAASSRKEVVTRAAFSGVRVGDLMRRQPPAVFPEVSVQELVDDHILQQNVRAVPVVEDGRLLGLVTISDVRRVPRERWDLTPARAVMTPAIALITARPSEPMEPVMDQMAQHELNQVPVVESGGLVGMLTRSDLLRYLRLRDDLDIEKTAA